VGTRRLRVAGILHLFISTWNCWWSSLTTIDIYRSGYPRAETVFAGRRRVAKLPSANDITLLRQMADVGASLDVFTNKIPSPSRAVGFKAYVQVLEQRCSITTALVWSIFAWIIIGALLLLLFERFSGVSQTRFDNFRIFRILKKSMRKLPQYLLYLL
jgi:hypothetical protein